MIRDGFVEPLDLGTPLEDDNFYRGVDAQPGHIAAGYIVAREGATDQVIEGLEQRRSALVAGPSGSGKSALTLLTASATAHRIVWYRIVRFDQDVVSGIQRLARALRAGVGEFRVGFVMDDVGRSPGPWDALVGAASSRPGLYVLGSVREEDVSMLESTSRSAIVRPFLDDNFAQALYSLLKERAETRWPEWREAAKLSNGLLMEYTHVLVEGTRLDDTISEQVRRRLNDPTRHAELQGF